MTMKKLKVIHLIDGLEAGGTQMMLYKLLSHMDRRRFDNVVVVFMDIGPIGSLLRQEDIPVYPLNLKSGSISLSAFFRVLGIIRRERPAVLQSWGYAADLVAAVAGSLLGIRNIVWNIRGSKLLANECSRATAFARVSCAWLSRIPRMVLSNTEVGLREHLTIGYRPRRSLVIPNGFDTKLFKPDQASKTSVREELGVPDGVQVIGMIARFHPMKDYGTFLAASEILVRTKPDTHFILCGIDITSDNTFFAEILAKHPSRQCVHLMGERRDISRVLNALDIFTLTSHSGEGFPNVVGEAMACGIPCVVTNAGDASMIVGETGMVVPFKDPQALARAWEIMLNMEPRDRQSLGQKARERVERCYPLSHIVAEYQRLYESLTNNAGVENVIKKWILDECSNWYDETYTSIKITSVRQYWWSRHYVLRLDGPSRMPSRLVLAKVLIPLGFHELSQCGMHPGRGTLQQEFEALSVLYQFVRGESYRGLTAIRPLAYSLELNMLVLEYVPGQDLQSIITNGFHFQAPVCRLTRVVDSIRKAGRLLAVLHRVSNCARSCQLNKVEFVTNLQSAAEVLLQCVRTNSARKRISRIIEAAPQWRFEPGIISVSRLHGDYYADNIVQLPGGDIYTIDTTLDQEGLVEHDIAKFIISAWVTKKALLLRHGWLNTQSWRRIQEAFLEGYGKIGICNRSALSLSVLGALLNRWVEVYGVLFERVPRAFAIFLLLTRIEPAFIHCLDAVMRDIKSEIDYA